MRVGQPVRSGAHRQGSQCGEEGFGRAAGGPDLTCFVLGPKAFEQAIHAFVCAQDFALAKAKLGGTVEQDARTQSWAHSPPRRREPALLGPEVWFLRTQRAVMDGC
jgi:hypothetical protein